MSRLVSQPNSLDSARAPDSELAPALQGIGTGPAASAEQAFFELDVKRSLHQHWRLARTVALGFAALAVAYVLMQVFVRKSWPTYKADSIVYVQPTPAKVLPSAGGPARWPFDTNTYETYIQQQMTNVSREDVLVSAVHKLDGFQGPAETDQAAAQRLMGALQVTRDGDAYQFTISALAGNPEWAAKIANAATAAYIESASRDERTGDAQRLEILKEEKDRVTAALAADRTEQDALNKQLGVASINATAPDHFDEDITQIRTELGKARTDHDAAEARFSSLDAGKGSTSAAIDAEADQMIGADAGLISMKTSLNARRAALISQMANLTPVNPQYKQDEAELEKINGDLDAMMKDLRAKAASRIQLQLRSDLQRTGGLESQLNGQLRNLVGSATSATPKLQRSSDLAADITRLQARYAAVDEEIHNIMLEDNAPAAAYQVSPAVPPLDRAKTGIFRNAVLIVFAGLFFGVMAAVGAKKMDPKVYIASDVEWVLGFAPLAQLPDFNEVSEAVSEEYLLRLTSAIEHGHKQGEMKNCIFTGTGPEAGVTTLVNRVRHMLEAMGRSTVLVDATGSQAPNSTSAPHAAESAPGLVPVERLSRPTSLLQQMTGETDAEQQSLVLTDTAPLTESAETEYLARFVDCAIVVIESGVTTRMQLRQAATSLQRLNVGAVGFVLNRVRLNQADPAFRASIEAVERRQQAQARNIPKRQERDGSLDAATSSVAPAAEQKRGEPLPKEPAARNLFEPEVAAAAAAVARFAAHPASSAPAVCVSSTAPVEAREKTKALSVPLVAAAAAVTVGTAVETEKAIAPPIAADSSKAVAAAPSTKVSAPFAEAARHFTSSTAATLGGPLATHPIAEDAPSAVFQQPPVSSEAPASVEVAAVPPEHDPFPTSVLPPAPQPDTVEAKAPIDDMPWWLSDVPRHAEPARPPVLWQPARIWNSRQQRDEAEHWTAAPEATAQPAPSEAAAPAQASVPNANEFVRADIGTESKTGLGIGSGLGSSPRQADDNAADVRSADLTSRLSGLRNLLFVLGVKQGQAAEEPAKSPTAPGASLDYRVERSIPHTAADGPAEMRGASPRLVTTAPEFLPPKPVVLEFDKTDPRTGEPWARQDRRDSQDRVDILPSKRGQYRKT